MTDRLAHVKGGKYWVDTYSGKLFTTRKAWREYIRRDAFSEWGTRKPTTDSPIVRRNIGCRLESVQGEGLRPNGLTEPDSIRKNAVKVQATPRLKTPPKTGHGVRVKPINGVWRRYLVHPDGTQRFVADYQSADDALACRNPIKDRSNVDRSNIVVQRIEG